MNVHLLLQSSTTAKVTMANVTMSTRILTILLNIDVNQLGHVLRKHETQRARVLQTRDVILAVFSFASKGFDVPGSDTLVLASPKSLCSMECISTCIPNDKVALKERPPSAHVSMIQSEHQICHHHL